MLSEKDFDGILMLKIKGEMKGMKWRKIEQMHGMPHTIIQLQYQELNQRKKLKRNVKNKTIDAIMPFLLIAQMNYNLLTE